ncbi:MAG TPA: hypothetical protein VEU08_22735 [Vicinamibacterales bacterium]|nr:hypothetical protein [Vicinamibacterales bacterium]
MAPSVLLVDPDRGWLHAVRASFPPGIDVEVCTDFSEARERLLHASPAFLITNLRLAAYNGLHLVLLATAASPKMRSLVYGERDDQWAAHEVQGCGAFFERRDRLPDAAIAFINGRLPASERRTLFDGDRRAARLGGRRATDLRTPPPE